MEDRVFWRFNGGNICSLALSGRKVWCVDENCSIAWTNSYRTRREAESRFYGDIRAMRKNDCYTWLATGPSGIAA